VVTVTPQVTVAESMVRVKKIAIPALIAAVAATIWVSRSPVPPGTSVAAVAGSSQPRASLHTAKDSQHRSPAGTSDSADLSELGNRIARLETVLAEERSRRLDLENRVSTLVDAIGSPINDASDGDLAGEPKPTATDPGDAAPAVPQVPGAPALSGRRGARESVDYTKSRMERALVDAGLDAVDAEDIKRHRDELAMTEMYLRDQATREGWLGTPRFAEEMAAVAEERTSLRDEIGDDAYDRYLFAMGQRNRVIVNDVMVRSAAEEAGLQSGDLIVSYGGARVFTREDLVDQTHDGDIGDSVVLRIIRNREPIEIEVPRGPLGVRVGHTQDDPDQS